MSSLKPDGVRSLAENRAALNEMLDMVRAHGIEPAGLLVRDRESWEAIMGPFTPMTHEDLSVYESPYVPEGDMYVMSEELKKEIDRMKEIRERMKNLYQQIAEEEGESDPGTEGP